MKLRAAIICMLAALFVVMAPRAAAQVPIQVGATRAPHLGIDKNDTLYLTMSVATKPQSERTPGSQTFFTMSTNRGASWDNQPRTRNLSNSPGEAFGPSIAVSNRGKRPAYIVYHDDRSGATQVYLIRSKKRTNFKKPFSLTPHAGGAFTPRLALDSEGAVYIVWGDTLEGRQVGFLRSTDGGVTFSELRRISQSPAAAFDPDIAIGSDDAVNVVWEDTRSGESAILFARSTDHGETFSAPLEISAGTGRATATRLAVDAAGHLHAVWIGEGDGGSNVFHARSTDGGQTFAAPVNVSEASDGRMYKPFVTTFEDRVYIAYGDEARDDRQVYVARSTDGGQSFDEPAQVSRANRDKGRAHSPAMVVDSRGTLHIVWIDSSIVGNDEGIMFYSASPNGRSFLSQQPILAFL